MSLVNVVETFLTFIKSNRIIEKIYFGCYPWFLPRKEDHKRNDSKMFLEIMRTIFGTCLCVCLQSVLLAFTETQQIKPTQILSISFSLICITKATVGLLSFKKPSITELVEQSTSALKNIEKKVEKKTSKLYDGLKNMQKNMTEVQRSAHLSTISIGQITESLF